MFAKVARTGELAPKRLITAMPALFITLSVCLVYGDSTADSTSCLAEETAFVVPFSTAARRPNGLHHRRMQALVCQQTKDSTKHRGACGDPLAAFLAEEDRSPGNL